MGRGFDARVAAQGGAGVLVAVFLVATGTILLCERTDSQFAWGIVLIVSGLSYFAGLLLFGNAAAPGEIE